MSKKVKNKNTKQKPKANKSKTPGNVQGGLVNLIREAKKMQNKIEHIKQGLKDNSYVGEAGDGEDVIVKVTVNGELEVTELTVSEQAYAEDRDMLTDLILSATNKAIKLAQEEKDGKMAGVTSGFAFPGLF